MWKLLKTRWAGLLGLLAFISPILQFVRWLLDWFGRIDLLATHMEDLKALWMGLIAPPPWLTPVMISVGLGLIWWDSRPKAKERAGSAPIRVLEPFKPSFTEDQRHFRIALKQFALSQPQQLYNAISAVRGRLIRSIKDAGDQDYSFALHHAMHWAWSTVPAGLTDLIEKAQPESGALDVAAVEQAIRQFVGEYDWQQKLVANLNVIVKAELPSFPEVQAWLERDKQFWNELEKLIVWPEANGLRAIARSPAAAHKENWTTPCRVNF